MVLSLLALHHLTLTLHMVMWWCLQEALLYEPWEAAVLRHPGFEPVTCPDSGRLLFAGPRLRMGLAEGAPHSVAPDHSGRANYSVSSALRLRLHLPAAAHCGRCFVLLTGDACLLVLRQPMMVELLKPSAPAFLAATCCRARA
jgi:hypothetical protein